MQNKLVIPHLTHAHPALRRPVSAGAPISRVCDRQHGCYQGVPTGSLLFISSHACLAPAL